MFATTTAHEASTESEDFRIAGEIAFRLLELEDIRTGYAAGFIRRLDELHRLRPQALVPVLKLLHGDLDDATESFNVHGSRRGLTKQAVFCEWQVTLETIEGVFPEVAATLKFVRHAGIAHSEPISNHEAGLLGCSTAETPAFK